MMTSPWHPLHEIVCIRLSLLILQETWWWRAMRWTKKVFIISEVWRRSWKATDRKWIFQYYIWLHIKSGYQLHCCNRNEKRAFRYYNLRLRLVLTWWHVWPIKQLSYNNCFLVACYATLHPALSVGRSVGRLVGRSPFYFFGIYKLFGLTAPSQIFAIISHSKTFQVILSYIKSLKSIRSIWSLKSFSIISGHLESSKLNLSHLKLFMSCTRPIGVGLVQPSTTQHDVRSPVVVQFWKKPADLGENYLKLTSIYLEKQGRIHGKTVADGWAGAVLRKPLSIQKS